MKEVLGKDIVRIGIGKRSITYHIDCFKRLKHQAFSSFFWREKPKEMVLKEECSFFKQKLGGLRK